MKTWEELRRTKEFWMERIQNDIFRFVKSYMDENQINQSQLAHNLGVSKGYVSQILNGNFNFSIKKLIELSLKLKIAPDINFKSLQQFINEERQRIQEIEKEKQELDVREITPLSVETSWEEKPESLNEKTIGSFEKIAKKIATSDLDDSTIIKLPIDTLGIKSAI